ncbi:OmpA family protein [Oceanivirga salmonicida]|uniref:OmpA family protein n=1 Tax=Oceanivirga salmonicida TaxID=1769291 RepID=UPI00082EF0EC|nr:OmpA family protein [Oceanivirga salmonicida]
MGINEKMRWFKKSLKNKVSINITTLITFLMLGSIFSYSYKVAGGNDNNKSDSVAIGKDSNANGDKAIAIGRTAKSKGTHALTIGHNADANGEGAIAIGGSAADKKTKAKGEYSLAIGHDAHSTGKRTTALKGLAEGENSITIGEASHTFKTSINAVAIGNRARAYKNQSVAIGTDAKSEGDFTVAILGKSLGTKTTAINGTADGQNSVAIGQESKTAKASINAVAIGNQSEANANQSVAIGTEAKSTGDFSVALGNAKAIGQSSVAILGEAKSEGSTAIGIGAKVEDNSNYATALGNEAIASAERSLAIGNKATAKKIRSVAIGLEANSDGENSYAAGYKASATNESAYAIGKESLSTGERSYAIGTESKAMQENSYAIGLKAEAHDIATYAIGKEAVAKGQSSFAIGQLAKTYDKSSFAIGQTANARGDNSYAIGTVANTNAKDSFAIGTGTNTSKEGAVALGSLSIADVDKGVVGHDFLTNADSTNATGAWKATHAAVSIGKADGTLTRQINGLAAGTKDTDAVNVAQIKAIGIGKGEISDTDPNKIKTVTGAAVHKYVKDNVQKLIEVESKDKSIKVSSEVEDATGKKTFNVEVDKDKLANTFAKKDASNIDSSVKNKWKTALGIGDGVIADSGAKVNNTVTGKTVFDYLKDKGLTFTGNEGSPAAIKLGETLEIKGTLADEGSSKNVKTKITNKKLEILIAKKPKFDEVEAGTGNKKVVIGENKIKLGDKTYITDKGLDANDKKIVNVAAPTDDKDAANKKYVDSEVKKLSGGIASKLKFQGNNGGEQSLDLKTEAFKVKGDDKNVVTESKAGGELEIKLKDKIKLDKITVDGTKGHITGLENKTWDGNPESGRAATEDQLSIVDKKVDANKDNITKINDKLKNVVEYDGPNKDKITLKGGADGTTITNVKDGVDAKDAVNKGQLDKVKEALEKAAKNSIKVEGTDNEIVVKDTIVGNVKTSKVGLAKPIKDKIDSIGKGEISDTDPNKDKTVTGEKVHTYVKDTVHTLIDVKNKPNSGVEVISEGPDAKGKKTFTVGLDKKTKDKIDSIGTGKVEEGDKNTVTGDTVHKHVKNTVGKLIDVTSIDKSIIVKPTNDAVTGKKTFDLAIDKTKLAKDFAKKDASNLEDDNVKQWAKKLSEGASIKTPDANKPRLVTDKQVHDHLKDNYYDKDQINNKIGQTNGGIATSMAMANIPQVSDRHLVSIGAGGAYYNKAGGFALGISGTIPNRRFIYKLSAGVDTKKTFGVAAGVNVNLIPEKRKNNDLDPILLNQIMASLPSNNEKFAKIEKELDELKIKVNEKGEIKTEGKIPISCGTTTKLCVIRGFEVDGREASDEEKESLKQIVAVLNKYYKNKLIDVIGHTDNSASHDYNAKLGLERAINVVRYLKELGLDESIVIRDISSFGETKIVDFNDTPEGRYMNRRVELRFTDK